MSLSDLLPVLEHTRMERQRIGKAESQRRWAAKNREHLRKYKREWNAQRSKKR